MPKFLKVLSVFVITPAVFLLSIVLFLSITFHAEDYGRMALKEEPARVAYAALPTNENIFDGEPVAEDAREESIRQFLARYDSPLEPHAGYLVAIADQHNLDYRLIPAIAMQETNLCKKAKAGSHNCWGFGVYGKKYVFFDSYEHAIDNVAKTLSENYIEKGLETPSEIMKKYTPSSNGSWAFAVNHFMEEME